MSFKVSRAHYASIYGPTTGDSIRLADTNLFIRIDKDYTKYGDESKFGGGKTLRAGMGLNPILTREDYRVVDVIITNAIIVDYTGIYKADIGIKDGKIAYIGKGGNPDVMDNVDFVVGTSTEAIAGENTIVTAGGIDTHVHFITPEIIDVALNNGVTTLIGGGVGASEGTNATTATPGKWHIEKMIESAEAFPINLGFLGKGSAATTTPNEEQIQAGAIGLKVHEDWGATQSAIDNALKVADKYDVQVSIHTDTLNEFGFVEDTIAAINNRVIHTFHTEGAGGGHAPDLLKLASHANVLPASTNPTKPYTINTIAEHLDMLMTCHHLDPNIPEDLAFADSRIRKQTIEAEDILHDVGSLSIMSSDAMAMGRIGEVILRTWQLAHKNKLQQGTLANDSEFNDNNRVMRYIAKYTINPAIAQGISNYVGSIEVGKYADLVIWEPEFFGVKPKMILKNGTIVQAVVGDPNAAIPTPEPNFYRNSWGAYGQAKHNISITFVSKYAYDHDIKNKLNLQKIILPVSNVRNLSKDDMKHNNNLAVIDVDPQTYNVTLDGQLLKCEPAKELPLTQKYFLF